MSFILSAIGGNTEKVKDQKTVKAHCLKKKKYVKYISECFYHFFAHWNLILSGQIHILKIQYYTRPTKR